MKYLWVQDVVREGRVEMRRVDGEDNVADHLTKPKSGMEMEVAVRDMGGEIVWRESGGGRVQKGLGTMQGSAIVWDTMNLTIRSGSTDTSQRGSTCVPTQRRYLCDRLVDRRFWDDRLVHFLARVGVAREGTQF